MIADRLKRLRDKMSQLKADFCFFTTADYHGSEYIGDYFKTVEYFSGFTGSNADLLIWQDGAALWTDGRYFVQAEKELRGTGITMYRMGVDEDPTVAKLLESKLESDTCLAFDGKILNMKRGQALAKIASQNGARVESRIDFAQLVWLDRPAVSCEIVYALPDQIAGRSIEDKLKTVREQMAKAGTQGLLLTRLDDIMWLFNLRGNDIECNPVAMSYGYITANEAHVFLQDKAVTEEIRLYLNQHGVTLHSYNSLEAFCRNCKETLVSLDPDSACFCLEEVFEGKEVVKESSPVQRIKACKNSYEMANMEEYYLLDSVAVTRFIYWLKNKAEIETLTEYDAAMYLDQLRSQIPGYIELSFPTISAYGSNAAMMHYQATAEQNSSLSKEGFLLVDSGGQYMGATTDVTRTISLGRLEPVMREHYTRTAMGMLRLTMAKFLKGCTGRNLDILARQPLWEIGIDYRCGTGHGVGYILNVHEGPQGIRWKYNKNVEETVLEEGMVVTNEPGVYVDGKYGIRIENVLTICNGEKNEYGQFLQFKTLTWVPLDREAVDESYFDDTSRKLYNAYQEKVYEKIGKYLNEEERQWLFMETRPL